MNARPHCPGQCPWLRPVGEHGKDSVMAGLPPGRSSAVGHLIPGRAEFWWTETLAWDEAEVVTDSHHHQPVHTAPVDGLSSHL